VTDKPGSWPSTKYVAAWIGPPTCCGFDARPPDRGASVAAPLEASDRRFRYLVDAAGGRPKVLYLRHDGDCGLVEPEVTGVT
jgi:hypothetical protein